MNADINNKKIRTKNLRESSKLTSKTSFNREICICNESATCASKTKKRSTKTTFELKYTNYISLKSNHNETTIWKNVFLNCDLKTIFILRSVSQMFHHLSTRIHSNYSSRLLVNRHIAQEKINISMTSFMDSPAVHNILQKNEIALIITHIDELNAFIELSKDYHNRSIIDKIKELNLSEIEINGITFDLINSLLDINFPELTKLAIGDVIHSEIIFPETMSNLKTLSIGNIINCHIDLPESMNQLITLSIGNSYPKSTVNFPLSLESIQSVKFGDIKETVAFVLPRAFSNATTLTIGNIEEGSVLDLALIQANNFKNITIGEIHPKAILVLPKILDNLEALTFGDLFCQVTICFPKLFPSLTKLTLGNLRFSSQWRLFNGMINLRTLIIGDLSCKVRLELPNECGNLLSLTIGKIRPYSHVKFPMKINDLLKVKLGYISDNVNFEVSDPQNKILSLELEETQDSDVKEMLYQCFLKKKSL